MPKEKGTFEAKNGPLLIVSLTSFPARIPFIHLTLHTLLNQSLKPNKLILWLAREQFPNGECELPREVTRLRQYGLEIRWCEDIRSYKKLVPALREFPNDILVTADDDILYCKNWLRDLYRSYLLAPHCVHAHRVRVVGTIDEHTLAEYHSWKLNATVGTMKFTNFLTTGGGVLFPPHSLSSEVLDVSKFTTLSPTADDVWFWAMTVNNGVKIREASRKYRSCIQRMGADGGASLYDLNILQGRNDVQLREVISAYPRVAQFCWEEGGK